MNTKKQSLSHTFIYSLIIIFILSSSVPFYFWVDYLIYDFKKDSRQIREDYMISQKTLLKSQVDNVIQTIEADKANAEKKLKIEIKERVYEAYKTCSLIYEKNKNKVGKDQIYKLIHDALWYREWDGGSGYIFAEYLNGVEYINRNNPELEGVNILDLQDDRGTYLMKEILNVVEDSGEGYCSYYWNVPGSPGVFTRKISFVKVFQPLDIVIGSGKYIEQIEDEIKAETLERISKISLADEGYVFAGQWDGLSLSGPSTGNNMLSVTDPDGVEIVSELIDASKEGGGFVEYVMPKIDGQRPAAKLSYADGIEDWQWYIGAGKYIDIIEKVINQNKENHDKLIRNAVIKVAVLFFLILILGIVLLNWFSKNINLSIATFVHAFKNAEKGNGSIESENVSFLEFYEIADSANRMFIRQMESDRALAESEKKLRKVIENAHIPIMIVNDDKKIELLNTEFKNSYGYSLDDIPTMNDWWEKAYNRELQTEEELQFWESVYNGNDLYYNYSQKHLTISCKDALVIKNVEISSSIIGDHRLLTVVDITERLKIENEKKQLENKKHRYQKMEAIGLMAGGVAHDLNNILSGIVGFPELILSDMDKNNSLYKPIEIVYESALRASAVVDDLLTVARGVASKKEVSDLNSMIKDFLGSPEFLNMQTHHPLIELKSFFNTDLLAVKCSTVHIKKVVMNLVSNAMDAIKDNGTITVSTDSVYLDAPVKGYTNVSPGEYSVFTISDTGSGISDEDIERIFEPFYSKKVMGRSGTGLGLSIVWNTINDHNGYIDINTSKKGTSFKVYLPAIRESVQSNQDEIQLDELLGNWESILVVDDEPNQRKILSELLKRLNYSAVTLPSGEAAIEYLQKNEADLILLDMIMDPGINGYETFKKIKEIRPDQKAVLASGFARTEDVENTIKLGAGEYIKKPYTIKLLGITLKKVLDS